MIEPKQVLVDFLATRPRASRVVRTLAQPRPVHVYGIGAPKTGTKSIAAIFGASFRSMHEARYHQFLDVLPRRMSGEMGDEEARLWLRERDATLWLECEAAHPLAWFAAPLAAEFPKARFILTVRDCHSWLESVVDQHLNVPNPRTSLRDIYFGSMGSPELEALAAIDEYPLAAYLDYWARHNSRVLDGIPSDRLLVVPTQRLSHSIDDIARFVGTEPERLEGGRDHVHRSPKKHRILQQVPRALFLKTVEQYCRPVIDRLSQRPELAEYDLVGAPPAQ